MKFPLAFQRAKPAAGTIPVFDTATPVDTNSVPRNAQQNIDTNVLWVRRRNDVGVPVQRIVIACSYVGGGSPTALNIGVYIFETNLGLWIALPGSATTITPMKSPGNPLPVYFDLPAINDPNHVLGDLQSSSAGEIAACVLVTDPGSAVNGTYTIVAAADMGNKSY